MKLKDYFAKLKSQAKITNEDFDKFIETAPDAEIPDTVIPVIEENFLTRERAMVDKPIRSKIHAELFDTLDAAIEQLYAFLPAEDILTVKNEPKTHAKIALVKKSIDGSLEKAKAANPDRDKKLEEAEKLLRAGAEKFEAFKAESEKKIKEIETAKQAEIKKMKIDNVLLGKIGQIQLAKEFAENPEVKKDTINSILSKVNSESFDLDEKGQIIVQEIENGVAKPKFFPGTNDLVTVDKLLETASANYIKRNNGKDDGGKEQQMRKVSDTPPGEKTLAQLRAEKALSA